MHHQLFQMFVEFLTDRARNVIFKPYCQALNMFILEKCIFRTQIVTDYIDEDKYQEKLFLFCIFLCII